MCAIEQLLIFCLIICFFLMLKFSRTVNTQRFQRLFTQRLKYILSYWARDRLWNVISEIAHLMWLPSIFSKKRFAKYIENLNRYLQHLKRIFSLILQLYNCKTLRAGWLSSPHNMKINEIAACFEWKRLWFWRSLALW